MAESNRRPRLQGNADFKKNYLISLKIGRLIAVVLEWASFSCFVSEPHNITFSGCGAAPLKNVPFHGNQRTNVVEQS